MEEDDDAFLYGGDSGGGNGNVEGSTQEASVNGQAEGAEVAKVEEEAMEEQDDDEGDDDEEDDDSDSDLEIIVDGSLGAGPPAGYNVRPAAAPIRPATIARPPPSAITSDYTPNARPGQAPSATSLANLTGLDASTTEQAGASRMDANATEMSSKEYISRSELPEGPPPPVPITAPRLDLDPSEQSLMLPPETIDGEPGPLIYHVDPTEFEEKPWRRPGADLTDWFNYGFNEDSWKLWGDKKHSRTVERRDMEANGGRHDAMDDIHEQSEQNNDESSGYMSQMPQQQMQTMQAMMGASGMSMSPEQMMAFMGMGQGGMPGMGMPGAGMMGMPGMGGMFGQQNPSQGMFGFGNIPNMQMMQQPFQQRGTPMNNGNSMQTHDGPVKAEEEAEHRQGSDFNGNAIEGSSEAGVGGNDEAQGTPRPASMDRSKLPSSLPERPSSGPATTASAHGVPARGVGVPGAPTGPSRGGSIPKGPSADRGSTTAAALPKDVPTGPKHPGRRYNDRDTGMGVADSLDYGGLAGGNREDSIGVPRSPEGRRRQRSTDSRDVSTDRDRDRERERDRDLSDTRSSRQPRDRTQSGRRRHSSPEDELERTSSKRDNKRAEDKKSASASQRYSSRRGEHRDERRRSDSTERERDDEWEKESIESSASRRRTSTRHQQQPRGDTTDTRRSSARSERRRGLEAEGDSGSETERERKHGRSQLRAERRAGRDGDDGKTTTASRKRGAPEDGLSPVRSSSSRKRRS